MALGRRLTVARRRLVSSRRSREAVVGVVGTRRRSTRSASASFATSRSTRELAVPRLAPLVLRDGAEDRPRLRDDPPFLPGRERRRRLDVEHRLDAGLGLVRVLAARPRRARDAQLDLVRVDARPSA